MSWRQGPNYSDGPPPKPCVPAIVLINPKYPHNVGQVVRAASCYQVSQVWYTGNRVSLSADPKERLPREERMRGYADVTLVNDHRPFWYLKGTPVAIEVRENSQSLPEFKHPSNPIYVFGPEDGSIPKQILSLCHQFVVIPSIHCLNLSAAVYTVLYDKKCKDGY